MIHHLSEADCCVAARMHQTLSGPCELLGTARACSRCRTARSVSVCATSGWSGPSAASQMPSARSYSGCAAAKSPAYSNEWLFMGADDLSHITQHNRVLNGCTDSCISAPVDNKSKH